jgi:hypothetical protein
MALPLQLGDFQFECLDLTVALAEQVLELAELGLLGAQVGFHEVAIGAATDADEKQQSHGAKRALADAARTGVEGVHTFSAFG